MTTFLEKSINILKPSTNALANVLTKMGTFLEVLRFATPPPFFLTPPPSHIFKKFKNCGHASPHPPLTPVLKCFPCKEGRRVAHGNTFYSLYILVCTHRLPQVDLVC